MEKKITIYDIAKEAGVSPATVSRILTGNATVRSEKREAVENIIQKYDFRPNQLARGLLKNETKTVGFILPDITNPFFSTMYFETEKSALARGYNIILANSMSDSKNESSLLTMLMEKQVDAIVFMGGRINTVRSRPNYLEELNGVAKTTPLVTINGKTKGTDCYKIQTDEEDGMLQLLEYLFSLGHTRIGILGGRNTVTATHLKYNALRKALRRHNLPCHEEWIIESGFSMEAGEDAANKLLSLGELPTALIGISDLVTIGVMRVLQKHRIKVPQDISVAGFDDDYLAQVTNPALTSVSQNYEEVGKRVVDTILDVLAGKPIEKNQIVPTKLNVRDSCSPVG